MLTTSPWCRISFPSLQLAPTNNHVTQLQLLPLVYHFAYQSTCTANKKLSYCKQIARKLRTQYVDGIYSNSVTLKSGMSLKIIQTGTIRKLGRCRQADRNRACRNAVTDCRTFRLPPPTSWRVAGNYSLDNIDRILNATQNKAIKSKCKPHEAAVAHWFPYATLHNGALQKIH